MRRLDLLTLGTALEQTIEGDSKVLTLITSTMQYRAQ